MKHQFVAICLALVLSGCAAVVQEKVVDSTVAANPGGKNTSPGGIEDQASTSPSDTMNKFLKALRKKDVEGIKSSCSRASLENFEAAARAKNMSLEDYITRGRELTTEKIPEIKNEIIKDETATLEVLDPERKEWETVPFVKEDGMWRIAFDKMGEE